jgi:hypothetical protein
MKSINHGDRSQGLPTGQITFPHKNLELRFGIRHKQGTGGSRWEIAPAEPVLVGTDTTITSGSPVIRADQRLLWRFGRLRAARVSGLQDLRRYISASFGRFDAWRLIGWTM